MQKWEYKMINRIRGFKEDGDWWKIGTEWANYIDDKKVGEIDALLIELGASGWELVGISSRSGYLGGAYISDSSKLRGTGNTLLEVRDLAGFTSNEVWVFKRPQN